MASVVNRFQISIFALSETTELWFVQLFPQVVNRFQISIFALSETTSLKSSIFVFLL